MDEPGQFEVPDGGLAAIAARRGEPNVSIHWTKDDLDRCEHGRHSVDLCHSCGGMSHGNRFLIEPGTYVTLLKGEHWVRIGTTAHGLPILVCPQRTD